MQNELNREQIDAMVRAARTGGGAEAGAKEPKVEPWDVRRAGQIGREQLRVVIAATLVSAEHLSFREFLGRIPETTYLASCKLEPMGVTGALQMDLKVIFPIVDLL